MSKYVLSAFSDEAASSLEGQIAALRRNGIRYMEIRSVDGMNICKTPLETVAEYKRKLDEAGIRVATVGSCIGKVSLSQPYTEHLAMFLHTLGVAKILGASRIRMFSIFLPGDEDPAACRELVMERLEEMTGIARACGIALYHENEKGIYGDTAARVLDLMDVFHGRMEFIFDPANYIQCGCDPFSIYPRLRDRTACFHIKDALFCDGSVVPAGRGDGNIAAILRDFARDHEDTMLTVEPHLKTFQGLTDTVSMKEEGGMIYKDNAEAFDVAVTALKTILDEEGLSYE